MSVHYEGHGVTLHHGDCLDVLRTLPDASVDAVVTDPPYGLEFMGKEWDGPKMWREYVTDEDRAYVSDGRTAPKFQTARPSFAAGLPFQRWCEQWAAECLRVLKPGGHLLAFGGSRTYHRMTSGVEDAGFEIRDCITWHFGSGFPKSLDVSKAIDRAAGAEREVVGIGGKSGKTRNAMAGDFAGEWDSTTPATPDAERWQGWGTALKPATEFIVVARKPLTGTVAATVLEWGTGALNIDACRVGDNPGYSYPNGPGGSEPGHRQRGERHGLGSQPVVSTAGRWPANVVFDEHQAAVLDEMSGELTSGKMLPTHTTAGVDGRASAYGKDAAGGFTTMETYGDTGGASRFFLRVGWTDDGLTMAPNVPASTAPAIPP